MNTLYPVIRRKRKPLIEAAVAVVGSVCPLCGAPSAVAGAHTSNENKTHISDPAPVDPGKPEAAGS